MTCKICGEEIANDIHNQHNGEPLVNGTVCSLCNSMFVIPVRIDPTKKEDIIKEIKSIGGNI